MDAQPNPANRGTPARRDPSADAEPARRKRVFSGIQPTAVMTIGNYFGAAKNWVRLQEEHDAVYCVVDLHAMTTRYDPAELRRSSREMFVALLAAGIDPDKATVFVQSSVPEHTELCWVLATLASLGDLGRMTQFKEKSGMLEGDAGPASAKPNPPSSNPAEPHRAVASPAKPDRAPGPGREEGGFVSSGLLFYPVLQAADILAYRAALVPVGQDQSQHLELSRGLARRFNSRFGHVFPEPETLHTPVPKLLSPADPRPPPWPQPLPTPSTTRLPKAARTVPGAHSPVFSLTSARVSAAATRARPAISAISSSTSAPRRSTSARRSRISAASVARASAVHALRSE